jgi:hypothetical protein
VSPSSTSFVRGTPRAASTAFATLGGTLVVPTAATTTAHTPTSSPPDGPHDPDHHQHYLRASAQNILSPKLLRSAAHASDNRKALQVHENDLAEVVIVCEPEGTSSMMGGLHPRSSLFEKPLNMDKARAQHTRFREVMRNMVRWVHYYCGCGVGFVDQG